MIEKLKGRLVLTLGITIVLNIIFFYYLASLPIFCEYCPDCPPCPRNQLEANPSLVFYGTAWSFVITYAVIFLILHIVSKYKK